MKIPLRSLLLLCILFLISSSCKQKTSLPDPLLAGWKGEPVCELLHEDSELRVLRCTFEPGVGHERHYHKPHYGYAISGSRFQLKDTTGIREVDIFSGTGFSSKGTKWHEVLNVGDSTAIFLIIEPK